MAEDKNSSPTKGENIKIKSETDCEVSDLNTNIEEASGYTLPDLSSREIVKMPWWNEELTILRNILIIKRNQIRLAPRIWRETFVEEYREARFMLKTEAVRAFTESLKEDRKEPMSRPEEECHPENREARDNNDNKLKQPLK